VQLAPAGWGNRRSGSERRAAAAKLQASFPALRSQHARSPWPWPMVRSRGSAASLAAGCRPTHRQPALPTAACCCQLDLDRRQPAPSPSNPPSLPTPTHAAFALHSSQATRARTNPLLPRHALAKMAQRVTLRTRKSYNTKSARNRVVKTPGGKLVVHNLKKIASRPKCGDCGTALPGVPGVRHALQAPEDGQPGLRWLALLDLRPDPRAPCLPRRGGQGRFPQLVFPYDHVS
jgi:hypothetical protein